jgi:hypothetical protein
MSSSRWVRPDGIVTGRSNNESGRLNSKRVRELLGNDCILDQAQIEELADGLSALADFAVTAFVEKRKQKPSVSEQPMPVEEAAAFDVTVA